MPYANEHAARLRDPKDFARIVQIGGSENKGIRILGGPLKSDPSGPAKTQAIRFKSAKWSVADAKKWLKEHGYKPIMFEAATGKAESAYDYACSVCGYLVASWDGQECGWCDGEIAAAGETTILRISSGPGEDDALIIEAGAKAVRVHGLAYAGGPMKLPGWQYPVVVDLDGLELPPEIPLLCDHENKTGSRVGVVRARRDGNTLLIEGSIIAETGNAINVLTQGRAADWQLSIGAEVKTAVIVRQSRFVNGQAVTGPFYHVTKATLREVSVLPVGADRTTRLQIAATFSLAQGGLDMQFEQWLTDKGFDPKTLSETQTASLRAAFDAEVKAAADLKAAAELEAKGGAKPPKKDPDDKARDALQITAEATADLVAQITEQLEAKAAAREKIADICKDHPELLVKARAEAWDEVKAELEVMRADRGHLAIHPATSQARTPEVLTAALSFGLGIGQQQLEKEHKPEVLEAAYPLRRMSLREVALMCCRMEGKETGPTFDNDTIRAAFSTVALPGILGAVANKSLLAAFITVDPVSERIAKQVDLTNFHLHTRYRMSIAGDMETVGADGELKHMYPQDESYTNQLDTYGVIIALTRQHMMNDDLGAFTDIPRLLGRKAAISREKAMFTLINATAAGASFFTTANGNYFAGATSNLSITSLGTAAQMFLDQTDAQGDPIGVVPRILLVPTSEIVNAKSIYTDVTVNETTTANVPKPNGNPHRGLYRPEVSPYLSNANLTGYSTTAWYLLADPNDICAFEVAYLRGQRTPVIEQGNVDFNVLGIQYRCYWDFGAALAEEEGGVKSKGAAA